MFPTLFDSAWIGLDGSMRFTIPAYFTAIFMGYLGAVFMAHREASRLGIDRDRFKDFAIWMLIIGVLAGRVLHVLVDGFLMDYIHLASDPFAMNGLPLAADTPCFQNESCLELQQKGRDIGGICNPLDGLCYPQQDPFRWLKFWAGGLTVYGSVLGCVFFSLYYLRRFKMPIAKIMDLGGYGIFFGIFVGRLGCLAAGCCFGGLCDVDAVSIQFPTGSLAYQHHFDFYHDQLSSQWAGGDKHSLPVWPTQLLSSAYNFIIFATAYFVVRPRKRFDGQVLITSAMMYAVFRFSIEFVRDDFRGGLLGLSTSQIISLVLFVVCAILLQRGLARARERRKQALAAADRAQDGDVED